MTKLVFDIDWLIFESVSVAEERFIIATHIPTDRKMEFKTKTELWGDWRKKAGGWIAEENKKLGNDYWKPDDFTIVEGQRPRPFKVKGVDEFTGEPDESKDYFISPWEGAKKILDDKIKAICEKFKTKDYTCFTGTGNVFRHDICTLLYYKDRDEMMKPLLLKKMKEYVCERHSCTMVTTAEADDAVNWTVLDGYKAWVKGGKKDEDKVTGIAVDKDSKQCSGWWFNPNKDKEPRLIEGFGKLWLDAKGEVDGEGRMWLYFQLFEDKADNYKANCFSDIKWGEKASYNALKDCKNDKEAWTVLVESFKTLYPEPKIVDGCKGKVEIDAMYVLQEMADMAFMLRHNNTPRDRLVVKDVLEKLGVNYA